MIFSDEQTLYLAHGLNMGFGVYIHKYTHDVVRLPEYALRETDGLSNEVKEEKEMVERNADKYVRLEPMDLNELFKAMEGFLRTVEDVAVQQKMLSALRSKEAYKRLRDVISDDVDQKAWSLFRTRHQQELVKQQLVCMFNNEIRN